jgi:hypothetical protein
MKCLGFVLLFGFISLGAIGGCNNNGGGQDGTPVHTEHDFGQDEGLRADPENHTIVKFLEHPDHDEHENDTGEVGYDVIPHTYKRTVDHTFCWEDEDDSADHFMLIIDEQGNEIVRLHAGDCVTETILEGDYDMELHHDGIIDRNYPIFIRHGHDEDLTARMNKKPGTMLARTMGVFYRILDRLDIGIIKTTFAQTVQDNINTLITTNSCEGCDLESADLSGAFLRNADLRFADLSFALLISADLRGADLTFADLSFADLIDADLRNANLTDAFLRNADLSGADLTFADLSGADLTCAFLIDADLTFAFLIDADLTFADLTGATWCDGFCLCGPMSFGIGPCVGCAPVDEVCTGP